MTAEEILEMHFGSDFYLLEENNYLSHIIAAMKEYARIQIEKDREKLEEASYEYFSGERSVYEIHQENPIELD